MSPQTWLPLLIVGAVLALRWRNLDKPRRLRPGRLWIGPLVMTLAVGLAVFGMPVSRYGVLAVLGGLALGVLVGWRRAHLLRLDRDPASGGLQIRQTPAAFVLIVALLLVKRVLVPRPGADSAGHIAPQALIATDALMGFALGMILATNLTLWLRAREVPHAAAPTEED
jgi:membrane protein CcdC involved in cytochrome C biogenesis